MKNRFKSRFSANPKAKFLLFFFCVALLFYLFFGIPGYSYELSLKIVISLTSTKERFQLELPIALLSILSQTFRPTEIHVYLSNDEATQTALEKLHVTHPLNHPKITVQSGQDYGSASKFIPVIEEFKKSGPKNFLSNVITF